MRFRKGSWVEVETPGGMWQPAMILSGDGHRYVVQYCWPSSSSRALSQDRVPRKALRPIPAPMTNYVNWAPGDIAEVFHEGIWTPAEVVGMVDTEGGMEFFVRLGGSSMKVKAPREHLRLPQIWQDERWIVIPKDSRKCQLFSSRSQCKVVKSSAELIQNHEDFNGSVLDVCSSTKRKSSVLQLSTRQCSNFTKRQRIVDRDGQCQLLGCDISLHLMTKVDAVVSPCSMGEKYMHSSLGNPNDFLEYSARQLANSSALDNSDAESTSSSVGSCSPYRLPFELSNHHLGAPCQNKWSPDVAECSVLAGVPSLSAKDVIDAETHLMELHAYRATLVAFHASGPISWEKEALITNLRLLLNISIDEHLAELRNLVSSGPSR